MNKTMTSLAEKFSEEDVKKLTKLQSNGKLLVLDFIPANKVIERLNSVYDDSWEFRVIDRVVEVGMGQVAILGELSVPTPTEADPHRRCVKQQWGGTYISKGLNGKVLNLGDDLKVSATDSLKKCATLLGVCLYLYNDDCKTMLDPSDPTSELEIKKLQEEFNKGADGTDLTKITEQQMEALKNVMGGKKIDLDVICKCLNITDISQMLNEDAGMLITLKHPLLEKIFASKPEAK